jgi:hypothetical protein
LRRGNALKGLSTEAKQRIPEQIVKNMEQFRKWLLADGP